jgi:hypothetical protein
MRPSFAATFALGSLLLLAASSGSAVTLEDCAVWLQQLRNETGQVAIGGAAGGDDRKTLVKHLDDAAVASDAKPTADTMRNVDEFRKRAAVLASQGRVSKQEGQRLDTIADTYRHCLEAAQK